MSLAKQYDESLVDFYDEELVGHADTVYRFAFALTLSPEAAHALTRETYQIATSNLKSIRGAEGSAAVAWLLGECWRAFGARKPAQGESLSSPVAKALKELPVEGRAVLLAVDVAGVSPAEATRAFGWSETDLRTRLAAARKALLATGAPF